MRLVESMARTLVLLYPAAFRRRYAGPMLEALEDRLADSRRQGRVRLLWVSLRSLGELLLSGIVERFGRSRQSPRRPRRPRGNLMDGLLSDLRYTFRSLRARPGFSALVLVTLAIGIGASTAVFTVVNGVLLEPLPYPETDRLVRLRTLYADGRSGSMSEPDLIDLAAQVPGIDLALGYSPETFTLTGLGDAELIRGAVATGPLLRALGYEVQLGRDFTEVDGREDGEPIAMIGHDLWQQRFGGDPAIVGRTITLGGRERRIVGVAPPGADFPRRTQVWLPFHYDFEECGRGCGIYSGIARLAPGVELDAVRTEIAAVGERLSSEYPSSNATKGFTVVTITEDVVGDVRVGLTMLMFAVLTVLLIACANVANILLVRGTSRTGEIALRSALGASRVRLIRQLMLENLVLALVAGAMGIGLAQVGTASLLALAPADLPRLDEVRVDRAAVAFAMLAAAFTTVLSGLLPAWRASRARQVDGMAGVGARATSGTGESRSRAVLVTVEVALSLVLLLGAGLMARSFHAMSQIDLGFQAENRVQLSLTLPEAKYSDGEQIVAAHRELREQLGALPGVLAVGGAFGSPMGDAWATTRIRFHDRPEPPPGERIGALTRVVTPGYFAALGMPLLAGRDVEEADTVDSPWVAVVSRSFADRFYPGGDAMGNEFTPGLSFYFDQDQPRRIVGIVEDARSLELAAPPQPEVYLAQAQTAANYLTYVLHSTVAPQALAAQVREVVRHFDADLPLQNFGLLESAVAEELAPTRFYLTLLLGFAALAVTLAALGLYAGIAFSVAQRRREIAVRMALGARASGVVWLMLQQGAPPLLLGVLAGLVGARMSTRAIETLLYETSPDDPLGYAVAVLAVVAIGALAATVPALRASRVEPSSALRAD